MTAHIGVCDRMIESLPSQFLGRERAGLRSLLTRRAHNFYCLQWSRPPAITTRLGSVQVILSHVAWPSLSLTQLSESLTLVTAPQA